MLHLSSKSWRNKSTTASNSSMLVIEGIMMPCDRLISTRMQSFAYCIYVYSLCAAFTGTTGLVKRPELTNQASQPANQRIRLPLSTAECQPPDHVGGLDRICVSQAFPKLVLGPRPSMNCGTPRRTARPYTVFKRKNLHSLYNIKQYMFNHAEYCNLLCWKEAL